MAQINKFSVKSALNMSVACFWHVRPRLNISSQAHIGRVVAPDTSIIQVQSDSAFHMRFSRSVTVKTITAVASNGAGSAKVAFTCEAHGLSDTNVVAMCGFENDALNIIGVVANKTTDDFDIETLDWVAGYAGDTGYAVVTSDAIVANNDFVYPAGEIIPFAVPWGEERQVHAKAGQSGKLGAAQPYPDAPTEVLIIHFKQYLSAASSYLKMMEG